MGRIANAIARAALRQTADYKNALKEIDEYLGIAPKNTGKPSASWNSRGGYSNAPRFDGAKFRGALRSAYASGYELDAETLRSRSRVAYWESTQARALLTRLVDSVIGTGLTPQCSPAWELIGSSMAPEARRAFQRNVELRFYLWATSHEADAASRRTLSELQSFAFANELRDGETIAILRYSGKPGRISPLSIQILDPDQIDTQVTTHGTPDRVCLAVAANARGNVVKDGFELSPAGELIAVFLCDPITRKTTRVPASGPSGRRFVVIPAILDLPGQIRGVGPLAPLIHEIQKLTDYTGAEIEAAVINAIFAAYIKPGEINDTRTNLAQAVGGGAIRRDAQGSSDATAKTGQEVRLDKPGMIVGNLKAGEDLVSFDTKRPNVNFDAFVKSIMRSLSASMSIPVEVLEMTFSSNYSASRASLILFWQVVERWRVHLISQFLQPVYEAWFTEEVAARRIAAPGYDSADPVVNHAS